MVKNNKEKNEEDDAENYEDNNKEISEEISQEANSEVNEAGDEEGNDEDDNNEEDDENNEETNADGADGQVNKPALPDKPDDLKNVNEPEILEGEHCPICHEKKLILREEELEIPYFGNVFLFSMTCSGCKFHKVDIECSEQKEPARYSLDITCEDDMKIRVVRSSEGVIKIPRIGSIEPGASAQGFISNVEGVLERIKEQLEHLKETEEDEEMKKKIRNMIKKINRIKWGQEKAKIIIEDPTGNSAIVSDKAQKSKL